MRGGERSAVNVYDFDKTIYAGDSTLDFYIYCLRKHPHILVCVFRQIGGIFLHAMHRIDSTAMKERFFSFLLKLEDAEALASAFWKPHQRKIRGWYQQVREETDLVISASPAFLLEPICKRLGIAEPAATRVDIRTGRILGRNCKGEEKVRRFLERFPDGKIHRFYSDSRTDGPLARLAQEAFLVKGNRLLPWKK